MLTIRPHRLYGKKLFASIVYTRRRVLTNLHIKFSVQSCFAPPQPTRSTHPLFRSVRETPCKRHPANKSSPSYDHSGRFSFLVPRNCYCIPNDIIRPTELVGIVRGCVAEVGCPSDDSSICICIYIYIQYIFM